MRRHRPAAWTVFGASAAILAGDALLALAGEVLLDGARAGGVSGRARGAGRRDAAADRRVRRSTWSSSTRDDVSLDECLDDGGATRPARCWPAPARSARCSAGGPDAAVAALTAFGADAGPRVPARRRPARASGASRRATGKPVLSDLRAPQEVAAGRRRAHQRHGRPRAARRAAGRPGAAVRGRPGEAARLVEAAGGRAWAERRGRRAALACRRAPPGRRRTCPTDVRGGVPATSPLSSGLTEDH